MLDKVTKRVAEKTKKQKTGPKWIYCKLLKMIFWHFKLITDQHIYYLSHMSRLMQLHKQGCTEKINVLSHLEMTSSNVSTNRKESEIKWVSG